MSNVNVELTIDEVNVILAGLGELPAKVSVAVITKLRSQVVNQLQAQQPPAAMPEVRVEEVAAAE